MFKPMFKELKEIMTTVSHQNREYPKGIDKIRKKRGKKEPSRNLEFKSTIPEAEKIH